MPRRREVPKRPAMPDPKYHDRTVTKFVVNLMHKGKKSLAERIFYGAMDIIEDTALSDEERSYLPGKAGATIPLAGMVNSTTDAIFGPLIGNRTSVTKSIEYQAYTTSTNSTGNVGQHYLGEIYITNVEYSGSVNSLQTFSADGTFDGAVTRSAQSTT